MPHVIITGPLSPEDIWLAFTPTEFKENGNLFRAEAAYLDTEKETVLIRSLCVERGFKKQFFVRISAREEGIHMSIETLGSPDRSDGVKRVLGLYTQKILQTEPEAVLGVTDIPDFIGDCKT